MKKNKSTLITLLCYAYTTTWTYSCWDHWGVPGSAQLQGARPRKTDPAMCREAAGTQTSRTKGCQLLFPLQICIPNTWDTASSKAGFKHMFEYPITNKTCLETKDSLDMKQFQLPSNKPHSLGHQVLPSPPQAEPKLVPCKPRVREGWEQQGCNWRPNRWVTSEGSTLTPVQIPIQMVPLKANLWL